jgi:TonB family protein
MARDHRITKAILLSSLGMAALLYAIPSLRHIYDSYKPIPLTPPTIEVVTLPTMREKAQHTKPPTSQIQTQSDDSCTCLEYPTLKRTDPFPYCPQCPNDLEVLRETKITYPPAAEALGVQGTLELKAYLNHDGKVYCIYVVKSPNAIFSASAVKEVSSWRYSPNITKKGSGLWCYRKVTINYESSR